MSCARPQFYGDDGSGQAARKAARWSRSNQPHVLLPGGIRFARVRPYGNQVFQTCKAGRADARYVHEFFFVNEPGAQFTQLDDALRVGGTDARKLHQFVERGSIDVDEKGSVFACPGRRVCRWGGRTDLLVRCRGRRCRLIRGKGGIRFLFGDGRAPADAKR